MAASPRRVDPLYALAALLFVATLGLAALTSRSDETGLSRTASVRDEGPGGAALLRRWLGGLGVRTSVLAGERFAPDPDRERAVLVLGASDPLLPADVAALRAFAARGGTVVVATEAGVAEALLLEALGVRLGGVARLGEHEVLGAYAAGAGAARISVDRGREIDPGARGIAVATSARGPLAAVVLEGGGAFYVVGSLAPFLSGQIGEAANGRFVLGLLDGAIRGGGTVAFDEYHHGARPAPDILALLVRTWPGRALLLAGGLVFLFAVLTGRRLGPPLPLEHRPPRSSLEHVRAFAGLVRRSGHGEIARERVRRDLRAGVAREVGMDPRAPAERIFAALAAASPERAAEARDVDALLARPLREADLLRTVGRVDALLHPERAGA